MCTTSMSVFFALQLDAYYAPALSFLHLFLLMMLQDRGAANAGATSMKAAGIPASQAPRRVS